MLMPGDEVEEAAIALSQARQTQPLQKAGAGEILGKEMAGGGDDEQAAVLHNPIGFV